MYNHQYPYTYSYEFPSYIDWAFSIVAYENETGLEYSIEEAIEAFASRWGGLDKDTFRHVLEVGQGVEKLIAIFALGESNIPQAQEWLFPLLSSVVEVERWASACCLGMMKDERAIPQLQEMLLFERSVEAPYPSMQGIGEWYIAYRQKIAYLFGEWGPPSVVPVLRQAFKTVWELEKQGYRTQFDYQYQDALAYALGQREALGMLSGLDLSAPRLRLAMFCLALGYLRVGDRYPHFNIGMMFDKVIEQEVAVVLEQRFGLTEEERIECIKNYGSDYEVRMDEMYAKDMQEEGDTTK
jgi:hypothetical protein